MAACLQLDLFQSPPTENEIISSRMDTLEEKQNKHCRSFHAKLADIMKIVIKQSDEIDRLKQLIYKMEQVK